MKKMWVGVNKCILCGTRLEFAPAKKSNARPQEGTKYCEKNHARFAVCGGYNFDGSWSFSFVLPPKGARYDRVG